MSDVLNLLNPGLDPVVIEGVLRRSQVGSLLPAAESAVWRNPRYTKFFQPLMDQALQGLTTPLPELTDALYADFHRTGKRIHFEQVYFERRRRLGRAVIAYLRSEPDSAQRAEYLKSALAKLASIAGDIAWALPAHVELPSGKDPLQIDLFGAETANLVAELIELLGPVMPESLKMDLRQRLDAEFFENYLARHEAFWWTKTTNNWNSVCHQGVIGAALSQLEDVPKLARMLLLAGQHLNRFVDGFEEDGGCSEGPTYWSYGFGWFSKLNAQLEARTGGRLSLFEGNDKIGRIARYGPLMVLPGDRTVNFSDCPSKILLRASMLSYLGRRLQEPLCANLGNYNYRRTLEKGIQLDLERSDFTNYSSLLLFDPGVDVSLEDAVPSYGDVYLKDLNVMLAHSTAQSGDAWHFAAKGGHNDEAHNHNDCGSYLLNVGEEAMIEEIGMPEYVKDYFEDATRYQFLAARTKGHSLGVINGHEQAVGSEYKSKVVEYLHDSNAVRVCVDLTDTYPEESCCVRYMRSFHFDKQSPSLEVQDEFELSDCSGLESSVITHHPVRVVEGRIFVQGEQASIEIRPLDGTEFGGLEHLSYQNHSAVETKVQRIIFRPDVLSERSRVAYQVIPGSPD